MSDTIDFENIYLDSAKKAQQAGRIKFAASGIAFKEAKAGGIVTVRVEDIRRLNWRRAAREFQVKVYLKKSLPLSFAGFPRESFEELRDFIRKHYEQTLEAKELSVKGWNWGTTEFLENELHFKVMGRTLFELPMDDASNVVMSGKNEVAFEIADSEHRDKKADTLSEIRFYVPGPSKQQTQPSLADQDNAETDANTPITIIEDEESPAQLFYNTAKGMAEMGGSIGDVIANFSQMPCITPRGRYDFDLYPEFLRLRGKSYDYKILYSSIVKFFLLPKSDDIHIYFVIGLDPPMRQGQTRYPFLVLQFPRDEDYELDLNLTDEVIKDQYDGKLQKNYNGATYEVVSAVFRGLTQKKITGPGTFKSHGGSHNAIKCNMKASDGFLYPLERSFLFVPKPTLFIPYNDVVSVVVQRGSISNSRSFDIKIVMKGGTEYPFSSINKEEKANLEDFIREKGIKLRDESNVEAVGLERAKKFDFSDGSDEDVEDEAAYRTAQRKATTGAAAANDEDESEDESFHEDSDEDSSDPEEYDEEYNSDSNADSNDNENESNDNDDEDDDDDDDDDDVVVDEKKKSTQVKVSVDHGKTKSAMKRSASPSSSDDSSDDSDDDDVMIVSDGQVNPSSSSSKTPTKGMTKKQPLPKKAKKEDGKATTAPGTGSSKGKTKKAKKEGPKRALAAFMYFSKDIRPQFVADNPGVSFGEIGKMVGAAWKELDETAKEKYVELERQDKERYQKELASFKASKE